MIKQDLIDLSPVRFFDNIAEGGLKEGQMGLITAKKGLGKTSVLVQFAIDALIQDKPLVHVSFDQQSSNVISWYNSVLAEIGKKKNLGDMTELTASIVRERIILNFNQETFTLPRVVSTIKALKEGGIKISAIIVDGADLSKISVDDLKVVSEFVQSEKLIAWFSDTNEKAELENTLPAEKLPFFDSIAHIASDGNAVVLTVLKANGKNATGAKLKLDSKSSLMTK